MIEAEKILPGVWKGFYTLYNVPGQQALEFEFHQGIDGVLAIFSAKRINKVPQDYDVGNVTDIVCNNNEVVFTASSKIALCFNQCVITEFLDAGYMMTGSWYEVSPHVNASKGTIIVTKVSDPDDHQSDHNSVATNTPTPIM